MGLALSHPGAIITTRSETGEDELVAGHFPVVDHLVREVMSRVPSHVDREDLRSAGREALLRAARAWDPERGVPFARYASLRIRGAILDELRSMDWASRSVRRRSREIETERARATGPSGERPSDASVAAVLGLSVGDVARADREVARAAVASLDADDDFLTGGLVCGVPGPEAEAERREGMLHLVDSIAELPDRLRRVVVDYFLEERSMVEIAAELGVSESRVSQMRAEALVLLRHALAEGLEPHLAVDRPSGGAAERRRAAYAAAVADRQAARRAARSATRDSA